MAFIEKMKQFLNHKSNWLARMFFVLVSVFLFQNIIIAALGNPITLELNPHNLISLTHTYDRVESSNRVESSRNGRVNWAELKNEVGSKSGSELLNVKRAARGSSNIYRAVSQPELDDIAKFGLRNKAGAYETGKLFAPTAREAAQFGKNNFMFDGHPNTIMKVQIPNSVLNNSYRFGADGMNAISIPANQLHRLRATPLNLSPLK